MAQRSFSSSRRELPHDAGERIAASDPLLSFDVQRSVSAVQGVATIRLKLYSGISSLLHLRRSGAGRSCEAVPFGGGVRFFLKKMGGSCAKD